MEEEKTTVTIKKEVPIDDFQKFTNENADITMEELPKYEDLYKKEILPKTEYKNLKDLKENPFLADSQPQVEAKEEVDVYTKKRIKIFVGAYLVITLLLSVFAVCNAFMMMFLNQDISENSKILSNQIESGESIPNQSADFQDGGVDSEIRYDLTDKRIKTPKNNDKSSLYDKINNLINSIF